jgi:hypothetical protein
LIECGFRESTLAFRKKSEPLSVSAVTVSRNGAITATPLIDSLCMRQEIHTPVEFATSALIIPIKRCTRPPFTGRFTNQLRIPTGLLVVLPVICLKGPMIQVLVLREALLELDQRWLTLRRFLYRKKRKEKNGRK